MFDRFEDDAKQAIHLARQASLANDTGYLDDVHLLIGFCRTRDSLAVRLMSACGFQPDRVELEAAQRAAALPRIPGGTWQLPFTPNAKRVLELAVEEAIRAEHTSIGTHHLLLGMLRGKSPTADALRSTGMELDVLRDVIHRLEHPR